MRISWRDGQCPQLELLYIDRENSSIVMISFLEQSYMSIVTRKIKKIQVWDSKSVKIKKWIFLLAKFPNPVCNYMEREKYAPPFFRFLKQKFDQLK